METLNRTRLWQSRLDELLSARASTPFEWGVHDCCLFGADVVLALTNHDAAAAFRGTYSSEEEARELLHSLGGISGLCGSLFGASWPVAAARVGDIGMVSAGGIETIAVCIGQHWRAPSPEGLVLVKPAHVAMCWRVG